MSESPPSYSSSDILATRPSKNSVDPARPYACVVEPEVSANGTVEDVATLFLTNKECPYRCLMCDLWKNTLDETVPPGAIPEQIRLALEHCGPAQHIKLYNSGNFFDNQAIPEADHAAIADLVQGFKTVIVENHPKLCGPRCKEFHQRIDTEFEVALGLETVEPTILRSLNKQMTVADYDRAAGFLRESNIHVRTFILIRPPFMTDQQGCEWAIRSMQHAFAQGSRVCSLIPTRAGNGIMEQLQQRGEFTPPSLSSIEDAFDAGLSMQIGRVFVDTWDLDTFGDCPRCSPQRRGRLQLMNLSQQILPRIACDCEGVS